MAGQGNVRAGGAYIEIFTRDSAMMKGFAKAQARIRTFALFVGRMGTIMARVGMMAAAPMVISSRTWSIFSDTMAEVGAVTQASADQLAQLNKEAQRLGRTTSFTAREVAAGMAEMGRAGMKPDEIIAATGAYLDLARGTRTELATAVELAMAAMRGFNLEAKDSAHIADVLTTGANKSAQKLGDLGEALSYVAPQAYEANESLEDTVAAIMALANNGIKGTRAGTALARSYKNLAKPETQKVLAGIGIAAMDSAGDMRKLADIMAELGVKTAGMGTGQRLGIFEALFGRGQAAALKLARGGIFGDMRKELVGLDGAAARTAKTMDDTLGGSWRLMVSAIEGVLIAVGEVLNKTLRNWLDRIKTGAEWMANFVKTHQALIVAMMKGVVWLLAGAAALKALSMALSLAAFGLGAVRMLLLGIGLITNPFGAFILGAAALGTLLVASSEEGRAAFSALSQDVKDSIQGIRDALEAGDIGLAAKVLWATVALEWQRGIAAIKQLWAGLVYAFDLGWIAVKASAFDTVASVKNVFGQLIDSVTSGLQIAWTKFTSWLADIWASIELQFERIRLVVLETTQAIAVMAMEHGIDPVAKYADILLRHEEFNKQRADLTRKDADATAARHAERDAKLAMLRGSGGKYQEDYNRSAAAHLKSSAQERASALDRGSNTYGAAQLAVAQAEADLAAIIKQAHSAMIEATDPDRPKRTVAEMLAVSDAPNWTVAEMLANAKGLALSKAADVAAAASKALAAGEMASVVGNAGTFNGGALRGMAYGTQAITDHLSAIEGNTKKTADDLEEALGSVEMA